MCACQNARNLVAAYLGDDGWEAIGQHWDGLLMDHTAEEASQLIQAVCQTDTKAMAAPYDVHSAIRLYLSTRFPGTTPASFEEGWS